MAVVAMLFLWLGSVMPAVFLSHFTVFVLSFFVVGYYVVECYTCLTYTSYVSN